MELITSAVCSTRRALFPSETATQPLLTCLFILLSRSFLEMDWNNPLRHDGVDVSTGQYMSYDNPYSSSVFPGDAISFSFNGETIDLNFDSKTRTISNFIEYAPSFPGQNHRSRD